MLKVMRGSGFGVVALASRATPFSRTSPRGGSSRHSFGSGHRGRSGTPREEQLLELFEAPVGNQDRSFPHGPLVLQAPPDISPRSDKLNSGIGGYLEPADIAATMPERPRERQMTELSDHYMRVRDYARRFYP